MILWTKTSVTSGAIICRFFFFFLLSNHPTHLLSVYDATDCLYQNYTGCFLLEDSMQITCHIECMSLSLNLYVKGQRVMQYTYGTRQKSHSGDIHTPTNRPDSDPSPGRLFLSHIHVLLNGRYGQLRQVKEVTV
jgi:hypothetical protein